jgi:hypothetical protein
MPDSPPRPRGQSSPGSPGISGAIKDAIAAVAGAVAPKSITQRRPKVEQAVDQSQGDDSLGRMKQAQSTDRDNSYSY